MTVTVRLDHFDLIVVALDRRPSMSLHRSSMQPDSFGGVGLVHRIDDQPDVLERNTEPPHASRLEGMRDLAQGHPGALRRSAGRTPWVVLAVERATVAPPEKRSP